MSVSESYSSDCAHLLDVDGDAATTAVEKGSNCFCGDWRVLQPPRCYVYHLIAAKRGAATTVDVTSSNWFCAGWRVLSTA